MHYVGAPTHDSLVAHAIARFINEVKGRAEGVTLIIIYQIYLILDYIRGTSSYGIVGHFVVNKTCEMLELLIPRYVHKEF